MKIAYILPSLKNVGPVRVVLDIVNNICNTRRDIEIVVYYVKDIVDVSFPCECRKFSWVSFFELYSFDIIHSHMLRPDVLVSLLPWFKGRKISTIHNIVEEDIFYTHGKFLSKIVSFFWFLIWRRFDDVVVLSRVASDYYKSKGILQENISLIYNGVRVNGGSNLKIDEVESKMLSDFIVGRRVMGTACRFNRRKGLEQVIMALNQLSDHVFIILGEGNIQSELEQLAEEYNVKDRVLFLGYRENVIPYLKFFDLYVMPSRSEGFPLALIEAVSTGIPTVCSNIDIFKEAFLGDEVSFFELDNVSSFVSAVRKVNGDFAIRARSRFLSVYTDEIMAENYYNLYLKKDSD